MQLLRGSSSGTFICCVSFSSDGWTVSTSSCGYRGSLLWYGVPNSDIVDGHLHPEMANQIFTAGEMVDQSISEVPCSLKSQKKRCHVGKKRASSLTPNKSSSHTVKKRLAPSFTDMWALIYVYPIYNFIHIVQFFSTLFVHCYVNLVHLLGYFLK